MNKRNDPVSSPFYASSQSFDSMHHVDSNMGEKNQI